LAPALPEILQLLTPLTASTTCIRAPELRSSIEPKRIASALAWASRLVDAVVPLVLVEPDVVFEPPPEKAPSAAATPTPAPSTATTMPATNSGVFEDLAAGVGGANGGAAGRGGGPDGGGPGGGGATGAGMRGVCSWRS